MYNDFKNLELLRHQVSSKIDKSLRQYAEQNKKDAEKITSNIFSACSSLLVSFLTYSHIQNHNYKMALLLFAIFISTYVIAYYASKIVTKKVTGIVYNLKHHQQKISEREAKEIVDDFDHIACDNNLIGKVFARAYNKETDIDIKEYEFYELYYYIRVSAQLTRKVLENRDICVNTMEYVKGIDLYRLYNQLDMLKTAREYLLDHVNDNEIDAPGNLRYVLVQQIVSLKENIDYIEGACNEFNKEHFSDKKTDALKRDYCTYLREKYVPYEE